MQGIKRFDHFHNSLWHFCLQPPTFGTCSAHEVFRVRRVDGVVCHVYDILSSGQTRNNTTERESAVLLHLQEVGHSLSNKCEFSRTSNKFLGLSFDSAIKADPNKTTAFKDFPALSNTRATYHAAASEDNKPAKPREIHPKSTLND